MLVGLVATVSWATVTLVLGVVFMRYRLRRFEQEKTPAIPLDLTNRLARIETAVESIAIEVERISENQRYLTKMQAERPPLPSGAKVPDHQR
jgi:hypothetical protein